jgi:hypothetical protein
MDVEAREVGAGSGGDALKAPSDDMRGILGGKQQDGTALPGRKTAQARRTGSTGDGEIQGEERFSTLGLAADNADP